MGIKKKFVYSSIAIILSTVVFSYGEFNPLVNANIESEGGNFKIIGDSLDSGGGILVGTNFSALVSVGTPFSGYVNDTSFRAEFGYNNEILAPTPNVPTFINDGNYYNKLKFKINSIDGTNNSPDVLYAIAITKDNWATINYVQSDNTVGATLGIEDYQTYTNWGGSTGELVIGLDPDTLYKISISALQGDFTGTDWSEEAEAATVLPYINMSLDTTSTNLGVLSVSSISTSNPAINITVNTNIENGYVIKVASAGDGINPGLYNSAGGSIITSNTGTLVTGSAGYGIQASSSTATVALAYDKTGNDIGGLNIILSDLVTGSGPVTAEVTTINTKASISTATEAGNYGDMVSYFISSLL